NSRSSFYSAGLRYQKFYPVLDFNYNNRSNSGVVSRRIVSSGSSTPDTPGTIQQLGVNWREHNLTAQISVPFTYYIRDRVLRLNLGRATQRTQRYGLQLDQDGEWTPTAPQLQH